MKTKQAKLIKHLPFLCLLWAVMILPVVAQAEPLTVTVDKTEISTDDTIVLTITMQGRDDVGEPQLPNLQAFVLAGSSRSNQTTIVNGQRSVSATYSYRLQPVQTGTVEIAGITAVIDNQTYTADPITINITPGVRPTLPPGVDPGVAELTSLGLLMEAEVNNPTPYVGEQILYNVRIFHPANVILRVPYKLPSFSGFWSQGSSETTYVVPDQQGRSLRVIDAETVLFPQTAGTATIGVAELDLPDATEIDGLHSEPVTVEVRPLPQPAPPGFAGAVGQFELQTAVDRNQVAVGEAIQLQVLLRGAGNIPALPAPELPTIPGWRAFDTTQQTQSETRNGRFVGARLYEQIWVPETGGDVVIPAIEYSYFDPESESYQTLRSEPIPVTVSGAASAAAAPPTVSSSAAPAATAVPAADPAANSSALRGLKTAVATTTSPTQLPQQLPYWLLWLLPPLLVGGWVGWERWQAAQAAIPRRQRALTNARRRLKEEAHLPPNELSERVLLGYLSDKLEQSIAGLPRPTQLALLQAQEVDDELVAQVETLLQRLEMERFAPASGSGEAAIVAETRQLVETLEQTWDD